MKYFLSNRQSKELSRGNTIRIAVPAPDWDEVNAEKYIRDHVTLPAGTIVWEADAMEITVNPLIRSAGGLESVFGQIAREQNTPEELTIEIVCVVANLSNRQQSQQGSQYPTQWPGYVVLSDGRQFPPAKENQT